MSRVAFVFLLVCCVAASGCRTGARRPIDHFEGPPVPDIIVALDGRPEGSGAVDDPLDSIERAIERVVPGGTVRVSEGRYRLERPIVVRVSGEPEAWIRIVAGPGALLDARGIAVGPSSGAPPYEQDQGAFVLAGAQYVEVEGFTVVQSHNAAITVRDSSHVRLASNRTSHSFSSGIAVWSSDHVEIVDNDVARASDLSLAPAWFEPETMVAPHEALTVSGVEHFVVARNHVHHGFKEGIDVKGDSKHGVVAENNVHDMDRQGIYVDAWEGALVDVEVRANTVHRNRGGGIVISAEGEAAQVEDVRVLGNRIVENFGPGIFITRFGQDGPKRKLAIHRNELLRNGWGPPHGELSPYHWITGGLYLFSVNVEGLDAFENVFVDNRGFQIGCSNDYLVDGAIEGGLAAHGIRFARNVLPASSERADTVTTGWPRDDPDTIVPYPGVAPRFEARETW